MARRDFRPWGNFAQNPQHTALSPVRSQSLGRIIWQTPIDLAPPFSDGELRIHYGAPLITAGNTVIVPVKTGVDGGFRIEAHSGTDGRLKWTAATSYVLPAHNWVPPVGVVLAQGKRLYFPGPGGTVYFRDDPDSADGATGQIAFYGLSNYTSNTSVYDASVMINTPLTADENGNLFFGFQVTGPTPLNLVAGFARISAGGEGTWTSAAAASGISTAVAVVQNCAPAISADGSTMYAAVRDTAGVGYLLALDARTLAREAAVRLIDPATGKPAFVSNDATASPMIGWDGDVFYGVLESSGENHERGWLLHFDRSLAVAKTPGAFGWDDTPSLVPVSMVPKYAGNASYLLLTKYNNYKEAGGDGINRIAVLDPNRPEIDPVTGVSVMSVVISIVGPTADGDAPAVKEWCINSAAVDPWSRSVLVNSEDGRAYRWDLTTNTFTESLELSSGTPEPYTPTVIGPDGTVYAINNASLFALGSR
jgi:hypothetical protein